MPKCPTGHTLSSDKHVAQAKTDTHLRSVKNKHTQQPDYDKCIPRECKRSQFFSSLFLVWFVLILFFTVFSLKVFLSLLIRCTDAIFSLFYLSFFVFSYFCEKFVFSTVVFQQCRLSFRLVFSLGQYGFIIYCNCIRVHCLSAIIFLSPFLFLFLFVKIIFSFGSITIRCKYNPECNRRQHAFICANQW